VARPDGLGPAVPRGGGATPNRFSFQRARLATELADGLDPPVGGFCYPEVYGSRPAGRLGRSRRVGGRSTGVPSRSAGSGHPPAGGFPPPAGAGQTPADRDGALADAGQWLAGSGRPPAAAGQPPAGPGQTPRDAGRSLAGSGRPMADSGQSMADAGRSMADAGRSPPESGEPCFDRPLPSEIDGRIRASVGRGVLCCGFFAGRIGGGRGEGCSLTTESGRGREPNRLRS